LCSAVAAAIIGAAGHGIECPVGWPARVKLPSEYENGSEEPGRDRKKEVVELQIKTAESSQGTFGGLCMD